VLQQTIRSLLPGTVESQRPPVTEPQGSSIVLSQDLDANDQALTMLQRSTDKVRETTKWLTGAFAAVGAALIAGLQLTKLGQIELRDPHIAAVLIGLALALWGVAQVIIRASDVLSVRYVSSAAISLEQWRDELKQLGIGSEGEPLLPGRLLEQVETSIERAWPYLAPGVASNLPNPSAKQYLEELSAERQQAHAALIALEQSMSAQHTAADEASWSTMAAERTALLFQLRKEQRRRLDSCMERVLAFANDCVARLQFIGFRRTCVRAGAVVAAGAILLAWGLNPPARPAETATAQGPRPVEVYLWKPVSAELRGSLGPSCVALQRIRAVAIGGSLKEPLVVLDPSSGCPARRLTITQARGVAIPSVSTVTTTSTTTATP
jgi:hypothetical protein